MEDLLQIGVITATHGIRGEVKIFPTTDDNRRFKKLKSCIMDTGKEKMELEIEGCKFFKQFVILKFKGLDNINEVERYKQCGLYVTRENAVHLRQNEYFIADLIGLMVQDEEGRLLGTLKEVLPTGANDVYVVKREDGSELLLPAIKQCVKEINLEKNIIKVHIMEGLLD